jgi:hypothetical protein
MLQGEDVIEVSRIFHLFFPWFGFNMRKKNDHVYLFFLVYLFFGWTTDCRVLRPMSQAHPLIRNEWS